ncbi:MAG: hypothetical protein V4647_08155 [Pseudomonadota bacterium]
MMADYRSWPLWHDGGDDVGNIDPQSLPISDALVSDLNGWIEKLDAALNWDDPAHTKWPDGFFAEFNDDCQKLAQRLKAELGPSYEVTEQYWGE